MHEQHWKAIAETKGIHDDVHCEVLFQHGRILSWTKGNIYLKNTVSSLRDASVKNGPNALCLNWNCSSAIMHAARWSKSAMLACNSPVSVGELARAGRSVECRRTVRWEKRNTEITCAVSRISKKARLIVADLERG